MSQITVLQAVSDASMEIGITQVQLSQALGSADEDVAQMVSLLNTVADEILLEEPYEEILGDGHWLANADGTERYTRPKQDSDYILFDGRVAINGLKYRFLASKGLEYGEQLRDFTSRLNRIAVRANQRVLDLNADESVVQ
jgi:hypothetical protein